TADGAGAALPLQAAAAAGRTLREAGSRFSAIVIVAAPPVDASRGAAGDLVEFIPPIVDSGAVVHAVVNRGSAETPIGGAMDMVRRLSDQTHGQFTAIFSPASYQIALDRLADRLAA